MELAMRGGVGGHGPVDNGRIRCSSISLFSLKRGQYADYFAPSFLIQLPRGGTPRDRLSRRGYPRPLEDSPSLDWSSSGLVTGQVKPLRAQGDSRLFVRREYRRTTGEYGGALKTFMAIDEKFDQSFRRERRSTRRRSRR